MNKKLRIRHSTAKATAKDFLTVRQEGNRQLSKSLEYYNLNFDKQMGIFEGQEGEEK